jgi:Transglutaminase-like superfamily
MLALEIVGSYALARLAMRGKPIEQAVAGLRARYGPAVETTPATLAHAVRLGWAVTRTLALLPGDTRCLTQSLVLTRLLAKRRISARLVIGARSSPSFSAHAWVEHGGTPVLKPGDESYGRLVEL